MKTRNRSLLVGLFALTLCGSVMAHDPASRTGYPVGNWSGSATVWSGSQGFAGWSGTLTFGNVYGFAPPYVAVAAAVPPGHRHGPSSHHGPRYGYGHAYHKGYKHDHKQRQRHGHEYAGHH